MSAEIHNAEALLNFPHYGLARRALGKALHWHYRLLRQRTHDTRVVLERIGDFPLLVLPGVLNPRLTRSGAFFASQLHAGTLGGAGEILDMGTGSGVCAIAAARCGRRVVAVDINPVAVRCAQLNTLINSVEDTIEVLQGDLFAPVKGRRFDVVLFNPPFIHGPPRSDADRAWRSTDVAERFAAGLPEHLTPEGYGLLLLSTYGDPVRFLQPLSRARLEIAITATRTYINERLFLLRLAPQRDTRGAGDD